MRFRYNRVVVFRTISLDEEQTTNLVLDYAVDDECDMKMNVLHIFLTCVVEKNYVLQLL